MLKSIACKMVVYCIFVLLFLSNSITITSKTLYQVALCDPNKTTREECILNFQTISAENQNCEPNKYLLIECNVCRCGLDGKIDKKQCTKHKCNNNKMKTRRVGPIVGKCELNHWYQLSRCHLCYCVNKYKLICNSNNRREKVSLGEYDLNDCGENLIKDLSKLVIPEEKLLRSVTKKVRSKSKNKYLQIEATPKLTAKQRSIPKVILLSPDKSFNASKSSEDKTEILMDISIKIRKYNEEDNASIEKGTKSRGFIDLFNNNEGYDVSALNINNIELNQESAKDSTDARRYGNSDFDLDSTALKGVNDASLTDDATSLNIDLSNILDTILNFAVRKSMVSIGSGNNCKPGTTVKKGCNICFCLANGKSLCTKKTCQ